MTNARNKDIVTSEGLRPRAAILDQELEAKLALLKTLFMGEHADFYEDLAARTLAERTEVIGISANDCYERALQKPSPYVGESAGRYMRLELDRNGFIPRVIPPEDFDKLLADMQVNNSLQT